MSVQNPDCKILICFVICQQKVSNTLINLDQVGYIKGRFIGENICAIKNKIDYYSIYKKNWSPYPNRF